MKSIVTLILLIIYIIFVPIIIDLIFSMTIRKNTKDAIHKKAMKKSIQYDKPLIVFDGLNKGMIYVNGEEGESFDGNIIDILDKLNKNSAVIILMYVLEYFDDPTDIIKKAMEVSGKDGLFIINYEPIIHRSLWDYNIKIEMTKNYNLPGEKIKWREIDTLTNSIQKLYRRISNIFPEKN